MQVTLVSLDRNIPGCQLSLERSPIRIGRHPQLDVSLDDQGVSDFHCQLGQINGILWVRDLGSVNGTYVNGFHVIQSHLLPGDELRVGRANFQVFYPRRHADQAEDMEREMTLAASGQQLTAD
ncbi:MAG: FHA domain-containing protein [Planctomycetota bacterium]|nr:FHA domain-containing protein [Planctomycetota bacterium]